MKLNSLLQVDDLIILSQSKVGLHNCLNTLSLYCNFWMLKINPKKPKIILFQNAKEDATQDSTFATGKNRHCSKLHLPRNLGLILWKLYPFSRPLTKKGPPFPL